MIRILVVGALALATYLAAATQVPSQVRLPVAGIVVGATVTQGFGCTDVTLEPFDARCRSHHFHAGIDLAAPVGTEVFSATAGTAYAGYEPAGAGEYIEVYVDSHVRILYCHLSAFRVESGHPVTPGQVIGLVGSTGLATGPHVHLQVDIDGSPVDPTAYLDS